MLRSGFFKTDPDTDPIRPLDPELDTDPDPHISLSKNIFISRLTSYNVCWRCMKYNLDNRLYLINV